MPPWLFCEELWDGWWGIRGEGGTVASSTGKPYPGEARAEKQDIDPSLFVFVFFSLNCGRLLLGAVTWNHKTSCWYTGRVAGTWKALGQCVPFPSQLDGSKEWHGFLLSVLLYHVIYWLFDEDILMKPQPLFRKRGITCVWTRLSLPCLNQLMFSLRLT